MTDVDTERTWPEGDHVITQRSSGAAYVVRRANDAATPIGLAGTLEGARRVAEFDRKRAAALRERAK